jgi:hypothetical protein
MRTDLSITYDDNEDRHYLNFDRIAGGIVDTGGYVQVEVDEDNEVHVTVFDQRGDTIGEIHTTVTDMIGGE